MTQTLERLKNFHFNTLLLGKLFIVWAKKVQRSYLSWHWGMIQTLERNRLVVSKLHEQFDKFWPEHLKVSKTFLLRVMAMKNDAKFEEELTCYFKIYNREFNKFWPKHLKFSNIFTLMSSFWARYILFELKKYRGVIFHDTEEWCKVWRKNYVWFEK